METHKEKLERWKKEDLERELFLHPPAPKPKTAQEHWDSMRHDQYLTPTNKKVWIGSPPEGKKKRTFQYN